MTKSTVKPSTIGIVVSEGHAKISLAKNIAQVTEVHMDVPQTFYEYDEVTFILDDREGLRASIEGNLGVYWDFGVQQMKDKADLVTKQCAINELIGSNMGLLSELQNTNEIMLDLISLQMEV